MKKNLKSSKIPHRLVCDDDGHWHLMPEDKATKFEQLVEIVMMNSDHAYLLDEYIKYKIDDACSLRIFKWEES